MNLDAFHTPKLLRALATVRRVLLLVSATLLLLVFYFAYCWQQALHSERTYFVTAEGTYAAQRRTTTIARDTFELENFTQTFLAHAFAHNEFTYETHLARALAVMDQQSGAYLRSKFNEEDIAAVYMQYNGLSTIDVERIVVHKEDYPYRVEAYYTIQMHFVGLEEQRAVPGAVTFALHTTARSRENPYGLLITHFNFIQHVPPNP